MSLKSHCTCKPTDITQLPLMFSLLLKSLWIDCLLYVISSLHCCYTPHTEAWGVCTGHTGKQRVKASSACNDDGKKKSVCCWHVRAASHYAGSGCVTGSAGFCVVFLKIGPHKKKKRNPHCSLWDLTTVFFLWRWLANQNRGQNYGRRDGWVELWKE